MNASLGASGQGRPLETANAAAALGPANAITGVRGVAALICAALLAGDPSRSDRTMWRIAALAGPALALDLVDGPVARRTGTESGFGARFDMEVDAATILVLAWAASRRTRLAWGIGCARYLFWLASRCRPAWRGPAGRSRFRRGVAGLQGAALWLTVVPATPPGLARGGVRVAAVLLAMSFGSQIVALERRRASAAAEFRRRRLPGTGRRPPESVGEDREPAP